MPVVKPGMFVASMRVLGKPVKAICDPIAKVCYPPLEAHWQEKYRSRWPTRFARRMLIIDFSLLTIACTLFVASFIWYFLLPASPSFGAVGIDTLAPRSITSGAATQIMVSYRNDSPNVLGCASLVVHLPPGTVLEEQLPVGEVPEKFCAIGTLTEKGFATETPNGTLVTYELGNLEPNARDVARLPVRIYGSTGSPKVLISELHYWEEAATAPERVSSRYEWTVADASIKITSTIPSRLVRGRQTSVTYALKNVSTEVVGPIILRLDRPADFIMTGSAPAQDAPNEWRIPAMAPGDTTNLNIIGYFTATNDSATAPVLALGAYIKAGDRELLLEEARPNLDPKAVGFEITHTLDSAQERGAIMAGERITVRVRYENKGSEPLRDATISLYTDGRLISDPSPSELTWNKTNAPELAEIAPGASGMLVAEFTMRSDAPSTGAAPTLNLYAFGSFSLADEPENTVKVSSAPTELPVATSISVEAAGFFYTKDGDQLGIGPLPPRVGETTKYRLVLNVKNTSGDARDVVLEAALPPDVSWTGRYSVSGGQAIDYLPTSNRIRWDIGALSALAGGEDEGVGASFEVALKPGAESAGHVAGLLHDIELSGYDSATGLKLYSTAPAISTELPFDSRAAGKGVVVKK